MRTYQTDHAEGTSPAFAIKSSPADRATVSRVLFQMLVESATRRVLISTPYFLPDKAFRRGVRPHGRVAAWRSPSSCRARLTDQRWVRLASRRMWGELLKAGVRIFEYGAGMTHVKALVVDDLWSVIGTTNVDNRSFEHNDEVNVAVRDETVAARITSDLANDLSTKPRGHVERLGAPAGVGKTDRHGRVDSRTAAVAMATVLTFFSRRSRPSRSSICSSVIDPTSSRPSRYLVRSRSCRYCSRESSVP